MGLYICLVSLSLLTGWKGQGGYSIPAEFYLVRVLIALMVLQSRQGGGGGGGGGHIIGNSEVTSAEACSAFSRRGASCGSKSTGSEGASSAALMIRAAFCLILFRRALPSRFPVLLSADNEVPDLPNHH